MDWSGLLAKGDVHVAPCRCDQLQELYHANS